MPMIWPGESTVRVHTQSYRVCFRSYNYYLCAYILTYCNSQLYFSVGNFIYNAVVNPISGI